MHRGVLSLGIVHVNTQTYSNDSNIKIFSYLFGCILACNVSVCFFFSLFYRVNINSFRFCSCVFCAIKERNQNMLCILHIVHISYYIHGSDRYTYVGAYVVHISYLLIHSSIFHPYVYTNAHICKKERMTRFSFSIMIEWRRQANTICSDDDDIMMWTKCIHFIWICVEVSRFTIKNYYELLETIVYACRYRMVDIKWACHFKHSHARVLLGCRISEFTIWERKHV